MSKEAILSNLKTALLQNHFQDSEVKHFDNMIYDRDDLLNTYLNYQKANMANVVTSSKKSLMKDIVKIIQDEKLEDVLVAGNVLDMIDTASLSERSKAEVLVYDKSVDEMRDSLFSIKGSILHARLGVANLGILGLSTGSDNPRLASLVTNVCIVLLKKSDIVANFFEAFKILRISGKDDSLPSNIVFMAGPSRTSDIELKTVFGVHGPQSVHVVVY